MEFGKLIDGHRHFTLNLSAPQELIKELDCDNISSTVLFGFNGFQFDTPHAQDDAVESLYNRYPDRIIPFLCDIDFKDKDIMSYIENKLSNNIFYGIGEILLGHTQIKEMYFSEVTFSDSIAIDVYSLAGRYNAPVMIHVDPPFWTDFENILSMCRNTNFICPHIAYDFLTVFGGKERDAKWVSQKLDDYPNLNFDISHWKISPIYLLESDWIEVLEIYNDRFIFGTDMTDNYLKQSLWVTAYKEILSSINNESAQNISQRNILRLCNLDG
jgi:predicted TIM-barrel fold metal-dependent hydrolase